jgi:Zn finger protein HypA/HybF involved in hydrogenase expression
MHERSLVADLVTKALAAVDGEEGDLTEVTVRVGALSSVSAPHLEGYFAEEARGTRAAGAVLRVDHGLDSTDEAALDVVLVGVKVAG